MISSRLPSIILLQEVIIVIMHVIIGLTSKYYKAVRIAINYTIMSK